jgi:F0F1-type ATP synthase membrane subunit c/vacuolar-type H+-ATPase subunit K
MRRCDRALAVGLATVILAPSVPALGDDAMTVVTKSGAKYRGELVEEIPNDHVTIKLATGEVKRFAWSEIEHGESPGPLVVLESSQPLVLERLRGDRFESVCRAPCNVRVAAGEYRVAGSDLRVSKPFALGGTRTTRIDADLGTARGYKIGMIVGLAGLGISTWSLITATTVEPSEKVQTGLFVAAGVGAVISIVGFIVAAANSNTVEIDGRPVAVRNARTVAFTSDGLVF